MKPNQPQGKTFDPEMNPFEDMPQGMSAPSPMMAKANSSQMMGMPQMGPEALQPGKTGDGSKFLLNAINQLHSYLAYSTDPQEVEMLRNLISVITQLVSRDQEKAGQMMQQGEQQMGMQNGGMQTGGMQNG